MPPVTDAPAGAADESVGGTAESKYTNCIELGTAVFALDGAVAVGHERPPSSDKSSAT